MRLKRLHKRQRGDTIVEVMIVLAVLGLAIGISYATANRSLLNARQAQESSQATQIAQSQLEAVISLGCASGNPNCPNPTDPASPNYLLFQTGSHCIDQSTNTVKSNSNAGNYSTTGYDGACITGTVPYYTSVTYDNAAHTFTVVVAWPDVMGQGMDSVTTHYRLESGPVIATGPPPVGGGGGGGPPPVTTLPFGMTVQSKTCGTQTDPTYFSKIYQATLAFTGTPGEKVNLTNSLALDWGNWGGVADSYTADLGNILIGADGKATKSITGGNFYVNVAYWKATATNLDGGGSVEVQICP